MQKLYGLDNPKCAHFARQCLMARRLVERGVRCVQIYSGGEENEKSWDGHTNIVANHGGFAAETDVPIAGLLARPGRARLAGIDAGHLGRRVRPAAGRAEGRHRPRPQPARLHHLAGRRRRQGRHLLTARPTRSATRPWSIASASTDLHATILHLMGIDHKRLTYRYNGRDFRLTDVSGNVIKEVLA